MAHPTRIYHKPEEIKKDLGMAIYLSTEVLKMRIRTKAINYSRLVKYIDKGSLWQSTNI